VKTESRTARAATPWLCSADTLVRAVTLMPIWISPVSQPCGKESAHPYQIIISYLTVEDIQVVPRPAPVPDHLDRLDAVLEDEIPCRELLAAAPHTDAAALEDQVAQIPTRSVLHEDADMRRALSHDKPDVLQARRLRHLPVDTSRRCIVQQLGQHPTPPPSPSPPSFWSERRNSPNPSGVVSGHAERSITKFLTCL